MRVERALMSLIRIVEGQGYFLDSLDIGQRELAVSDIFSEVLMKKLT